MIFFSNSFKVPQWYDILVFQVDCDGDQDFHQWSEQQYSYEIADVANTEWDVDAVENAADADA